MTNRNKMDLQNLNVSLALQAISPSIGILTFMRGLAGVFSAITTPLAITMITMEFDEKSRSMALGIFTAAVGLGEAFLPLLTGRLSDTAGWRSAFLISISTATLAFLLIRKYAVDSKDPNAQKLDIGGVVFSAVMMLGFVGSFLLSGALLLSALIIWFGMRKPTAQAQTETISPI